MLRFIQLDGTTMVGAHAVHKVELRSSAVFVTGTAGRELWRSGAKEGAALTDEFKRVCGLFRASERVVD